MLDSGTRPTRVCAWEVHGETTQCCTLIGVFKVDADVQLSGSSELGSFGDSEIQHDGLGFVDAFNF